MKHKVEGSEMVSGRTVPALTAPVAEERLSCADKDVLIVSREES